MIYQRPLFSEGNSEVNNEIQIYGLISKKLPLFDSFYAISAAYIRKSYAEHYELELSNWTTHNYRRR